MRKVAPDSSHTHTHATSRIPDRFDSLTGAQVKKSSDRIGWSGQLAQIVEGHSAAGKQIETNRSVVADMTQTENISTELLLQNAFSSEKCSSVSVRR